MRLNGLGTHTHTRTHNKFRAAVGNSYSRHVCAGFIVPVRECANKTLCSCDFPHSGCCSMYSIHATAPTHSLTHVRTDADPSRCPK